VKWGVDVSLLSEPASSSGGASPPPPASSAGGEEDFARALVAPSLGALAEERSGSWGHFSDKVEVAESANMCPRRRTSLWALLWVSAIWPHIRHSSATCIDCNDLTAPV